MSLFQPRANEEEWQRVLELAYKLKTPYERRLYINSGYTAHDLRIDLLAAVPSWVRRKPSCGD